MRIACPACNAAYQVPEAQLMEGRVVRCARCGTDWTPVISGVQDAPATAPQPPVVEREPTPEPVAAPEPERVSPRRMALDDDLPPPAPLPPAEPVAPRRTLPLLPIAWALSLLVVGTACAGLIMRRDRVMETWPPSIRAYAALGLASR